MNRLTHLEPSDNFETLMNFAFAKDGKAYLRHVPGDSDIALHEYASRCCRENGCDMSDDDVFESGLMECPNCRIGIMYYLGCQAAENNAVLMKYEDLEEQGRLIELPDIPKGKVLYWIWDNKIVRMKFDGISGGCIPKDIKKFMVTGRMKLLNDVTINNHLIKKGDKRYFYMNRDIGRHIFLSREEAEKALSLRT